MVFSLCTSTSSSLSKFPVILSQVIAAYCKLFRDFDMDFLMVNCNAPNCSRMNKVELRIAPLSFRLAGVVLDHQMCGVHLDGSKKTIDTEMELKNFEAAGTTCAKLFHDEEWGGHKMDAKYVPPPEPSKLPVFNYPAVDEEWLVRHGKYV